MATACGAALWVVAALGYLLLEAVAAAGFAPAYSYANNYISDLGVNSGELHGRVVESPRADLMHAGFYLQGMLFLLGALLIVGVPDSRRSRLFLGLIATNAVGNIVVGTVHVGTVHVAGAALAIVGETSPSWWVRLRSRRSPVSLGTEASPNWLEAWASCV